MNPVRAMVWPGAQTADVEPLVTREWLVTNGLGGYASGTIAGVPTRRYHGMLIAALPAPHGRVMVLNHLSEQVKFPDKRRFDIGGEERGGVLQLKGAEYLVEFRLELGIPVWRYKVLDAVFEKRVLMAHQQNTTYIHYRLLEGDTIALRLRPAVHFRGHDEPVSHKIQGRYVIMADGEKYEITAADTNLPTLRMLIYGDESSFTVFGRNLTEVLYRTEESRGYEYKGDLWSPGHFWVDLSSGHDATLVASTEAWTTLAAMNPTDAFDSEVARRRRLLASAEPSARDGFGAELVVAADQFVIKPAGRVEDSARARAVGDEVRSVIAGYHWFTDWGRDTMISLEGLTLVAGRHQEAGWILRMFAQHVRDGLIPNFFPEGDKEGVYHTADATLWFFHAVDRYIRATGDEHTLQRLLPILLDIVEHHLRGTRFGINVDERDGLLRQGAEGYQLTWMDAKYKNFVVTPRRGKAVEVNALWYNALCVMESWLRAAHRETDANRIAEAAGRARESFNRRFWYDKGAYLYDVVDGEQGDDPSCRPNQVFAISLPNPVLDRGKWSPVMETVERRLLTPVGLRSLAPGEPGYKQRYFGDLETRDNAYHQGTVWAWLIGPFVDAWIKLHPERRSEARKFLKPFDDHLSDACIGSISEVFDAEAPYTPRGCAAQAWSVAEVLRCWCVTAD